MIDFARSGHRPRTFIIKKVDAHGRCAYLDLDALKSGHDTIERFGTLGGNDTKGFIFVNTWKQAGRPGETPAMEKEG